MIAPNGNCCTAEEQRMCCAPEEKNGCCGGAADEPCGCAAEGNTGKAARSTLRRLLLSMAALAVAMAIASQSASATAYSNTGPINVPDSGLATPYPSSVTAQGLTGRVTNVNVALHKVKHEHAGDLEVLLVAPDGATSILMSDACGGSEPLDKTLIFSQEVLGTLGPTAGECDLVFYKPADWVSGSEPPEAWPEAPVGPHRPGLDQFIGSEPNGIWSLYVRDDTPGKSGAIEGGWTIDIGTSPVDTEVSGIRARELSGMDGVIEDVDVSLSGVIHERPEDLELILAGPRGQKVILMSDACGGRSVKGVDWGWNDQAPGPMNGDFLPGCPAGGYKPTDHDPGDEFPFPVPPGPYGSSLSAFDGTDPNGEWTLYAYDDQPENARGFFSQQFVVTVATRQPAEVAFGDSAFEVVEGERRELTLTRTGQANLGPGSVTVTSSPLSAESGADFKPVSTKVEFDRGETEKTVPVEALTDSLAEEPERFKLTIGDARDDAYPSSDPTATVTIRERAPGVDGADRTAPVIRGVRVGRAGRRGRTVRFRLSEPAAVTLRVQRRKAGRFVAAKTLRRAARAGRNRVVLKGRRVLRPGRYRLIVTAVDAAGNRSTARAKRFR